MGQIKEQLRKKKLYYKNTLRGEYYDTITSIELSFTNKR